MNDVVKLIPDSLLKEPCHNYLKAMISSFDDICNNLFDHLPFLQFWTDGVLKKSSPSKAMEFAFNYFNKKEVNESLDEDEAQLANDYLEKLISFYNKQIYTSGKLVAKFIRSFKSDNPRKEIRTDDFKWFPKEWEDNNHQDYIRISKEFDFAWKFARLWQLLESRGQGKYILNFIGKIELTNKEEILSSSKIPSDVIEKLKNLNPEKESFFKNNLDYFSPECLPTNELITFLKKACISSIKDEKGKSLSPSNARIKHLEPIWLLGRFFKIHNYGLDFIGQEMPILAINQFSGLEKSPFLSDWKNRDLDDFVKKERIKIGERTFPVEDVLLIAYSCDELLEKLSYKSNEILEGKEKNPFKIILSKIKKRIKPSFLSSVDYSDSDIRLVIKKNPSIFKALAMLGSFPTFFTQYKKELDKYTDVIKQLEGNSFLLYFFGKRIVSAGLENEKNLFFITKNDFDSWDMLMAVLIIAIAYSMQNRQNIVHDEKLISNQA